MNICYVVPHFAPRVGGVETHVAMLATRMVSAGHAVEVLTESRDPGLAEVESIHGVLVRRFKVPLGGHPYAAAPSLWRYLLKHGQQYGVVHAHSYHTLAPMATVAARVRPLVFTPHYHGEGTRLLGRLLHRPYRGLGSLIFKQASATICVSRWEADLVGRHFAHSRQRITIIPNGVDVRSVSAALPYPVDQRVVLSVRRLKAYKHVDRVADALRYLGDDYRLVVVGTGPDDTRLREHVSGQALNDAVRFLGRLDEDAVHRWYRSADVYVSMSGQEAFGITVLEALAGGASVVATDIPAHREVIDLVPNAAMSLVPPDITPPDLAERIAAAAVRGRPDSAPDGIPTWDDVAAQTEDLYRRILRKPELSAPSR